MRCLEIGCGFTINHPGYERLDIDPRCPQLNFCCSMDDIPVEDCAFDRVYSAHSLEHISWRKTHQTLEEWFRILKPGGEVHIIVPNLRWIVEQYLANGQGWTEDAGVMTGDERQHLTTGSGLSHSLWANFKLFSSTADSDIHLAGFDRWILEQRLKDAGFEKIKLVYDKEHLEMRACRPSVS